MERKIDGRNANSKCHLAPSTQYLMVFELQTYYPRENNAKMTQWKLYIIQLEEILYAREGH